VLARSALDSAEKAQVPRQDCRELVSGTVPLWRQLGLKMPLHHRKDARSQFVLHMLHVGARDHLLDAKVRAKVEALCQSLGFSQLPGAITGRRMLKRLRYIDSACMNLAAR
jgi:hypothetical protein